MRKPMLPMITGLRAAKVGSDMKASGHARKQRFAQKGSGRRDVAR